MARTVGKSRSKKRDAAKIENDAGCAEPFERFRKD
jgi:hypothetical protein